MAWALESLGQPPTWLLVLATPVALLFGYRWLQRRLAAMDEASARAEAAALSTKLQKNPKTFTKDECVNARPRSSHPRLPTPCHSPRTADCSPTTGWTGASRYCWRSRGA